MSNYDFIYDEQESAVAVDKSGDGFKAVIDGEEISLTQLAPNTFAVELNGERKLSAAVRKGDTCYIDIESILFEIKEPSEDEFAGGAGDHAGAKDKIFAPMPGKIVKIQVALGDEVDIKQQMVIVEAMKMENQVIARAKGKVKAINFAEGDQVDTEKPIIELDIAEE